MSSFEGVPEHLVDQGVDDVMYETMRGSRGVHHIQPVAILKRTAHTYRKRPITTTGNIRGAAIGWVYVGKSGAGRLKVGMSIDPQKRCLQLGVILCHAVEIVGSAAKEIETEVLRLCGAVQGDSEWVSRDLDATIKIVSEAVCLVGRRRHVDPKISADEARRQRIALLRTDVT